MAGSLDAKEIHTVWKEHEPEMRRCAEDQRESGSLKIVFDISAAGNVTAARAESVTGFGDVVVACMLDRTRALVFRQSTTASSVTFPLKVKK